MPTKKQEPTSFRSVAEMEETYFPRLVAREREERQQRERELRPRPWDDWDTESGLKGSFPREGEGTGLIPEVLETLKRELRKALGSKKENDGE